MKATVVQYTAKAERADENQQLVEAVFRELHATAPRGLRYASFRLDDGVSFVHIASVDTSDGSNPLGTIAAFAEFGREIAERCDEPPVVHDSQLVGSYGFFT